MNCAGHKKTQLAIFSVCYCKINFSLNFAFLYFLGRSSCRSLLQ